MSDSSDANGLVGTAVGLGITLGAFGLALNFASEAARGFPRERQQKRRNNDYDNYEVYSYQETRPKKRRVRQDDDIFNWENYV